MNFSVTAVPPMIINSQVVSSTVIRAAIARGDMKRVQELMGRPFRLHGHVIKGAGLGTKLGFPTANLDTNSDQAIPSNGVYATLAHFNDHVRQSMTNIGKRPTFGGNQRLVEVYIPEFQGNLYGKEMKIDIIERLRSEKKFDNVEELKKQMAEDVKQGKIILDSWGQ
jgi:riboflavin kinase/FMN adenylyltransferase